MSYLKNLKVLLETTLMSGGQVFGPASDTNFGGAFGNNDFYAKGDARNLWGTYKKSKKRKKKFPLYRRNKIEMMGVNEDISLDCMIVSESLQQIDTFKNALDQNEIVYNVELLEDCNVLTFNNKESVINKILNSTNWNKNKCLCFIGMID